MTKFILAVALAGGMLAAEKVGNGVSAPKVIYKAEPAYTEEAKAARVQGTVGLKLVVTEEGTAEDISVVRSLDKGLDEQAVIAVKKWRFAPGEKAGKAVPVDVTIEVNFRLQ